MTRLLTLSVVALLTGCATAPEARIPAPPEPVRVVPQTRTVYVPVETTTDDLRECLSARRAEAVKKSKWREYAERLERLLGIDSEDADK